jgi:hypothetical protein
MPDWIFGVVLGDHDPADAIAIGGDDRPRSFLRGTRTCRDRLISLVSKPFEQRRTDIGKRTGRL